MRFFAAIISVLFLVPGLGFLAFAIARYRMPYENGRYFDARTDVVFHEQTAELLVIAGVVLTLAGLAIAILTALNRRG